MPAPRITIVQNPASLLERAVDGLFPLAPASDANPWPTLTAWVVLRQGGLRDDLHRLAAARGVPGWFESPICLFNELVDRWSDETAPPALTEPERLVMVSTLVARFGTDTFGAGSKGEAWVPAVDMLIGELMSEGIAPADFGSALESTARDAFGRGRATALARVYAEWHAALARVDRSDGRDGRIRLARSIAADPSAFAERLGHRRDVRLVGLADLRGGWRALITALGTTSALDHLEIITNAALELPAALGAEYVHSAPDTSFSNALFTEQVASAQNVLLIEAPDAAREVELIAVRVRALIDGGTPPSRIAVIARQARPFVNDLSGALERLGVPVTARRRTNLSHTAPAGALRAILTAVGESWSRHAVVELAEQPLLRTGLDATVLNTVGFARPIASRAAWREALAELLVRCTARANGDDSGDDHRQTLPPLEHVKATLAAWDAIGPTLAELEGARAPGTWFTWVANTLRGNAWGIPAALDAPIADRVTANTDIRAADLICELALGWNDALSTFGGDAENISAESFADRLAVLLDHDLITPPSTDFGVVVAEALAAGWRGFDHVFVGGLSAGIFPARPATGGVLDADDRRALIAAGLPIDAPDGWRERERELFRVICAAPAVRLTLSWPVMDSGGREVTRSAFVDEAAATLARSLQIDGDDDALEHAGVLERVPTNVMLTPGFPVANDAAALEHGRVVATRENARGRDAGAWNGQIEDEALRSWLAQQYGESFVWSATQLEQVAKCGWHWFAGRWPRLDPHADPDDSMEPTTRGSIMHAALHRFFSEAKGSSPAPVFLREADRAALDGKLHTALHAAWRDAEQSGEWLGPVTLREVARAELHAELAGYLDFEITWNENSFKGGNFSAPRQVRTGFVDGEVKFDRVQLAGDGVRFLIRGSVDRVDRGVDDRVANSDRYLAAIDYKSSKGSTPAAGEKEGWNDGVVLQVPLYAAALRKEYPDSMLARIEYRTLKVPKVVHPLSFAPVKKGEVQEAPEAEAKLDGALAAAGRRIAAVRDGKLPANPAESCGCAPFCPARDICRVPGGPVSLRGK